MDDTGSFVHETSIKQDIQAAGRNLPGQSRRTGQCNCHLLWRGFGQLQLRWKVGYRDGDLEREIFLPFPADLEPEKDRQKKGKNLEKKMPGE
jgi:hypothetical protein